MGQIRIRRIYDDASDIDEFRVLVDRLWPRGISKVRARLDQWAKDVTPTTSLRQDFHGGKISWDKFRLAYWQEIQENPGFPGWAEEMRERLKHGDVTLLTAAHCDDHCHVHVLAEALQGAITKAAE
jgi:uncharacterized protein YeaO (DUF488 family)